MSNTRNAHIAMVFAYSLIPLLFGEATMVNVKKPESVSLETQPYVESIEEPGKGGPRFIVIEEEEEEEIILDNDYGLNLGVFSGSAKNIFNPQTAYYTGEGENNDIRRINWFKVAQTSLPVTRNIISSDFGWRVPPCSGCSADHQGVDFVPGNGTPVFAAMDGIVTDKGENGGYGVYIIMEHVVPVGGEVQRWETVYAHLQKDSIPAEIQLGTIVARGETIGKVGNTGMSTGPHLHFEIRIEGVAVDPIPLLGNYQVIEVSLPADEEPPADMILNQGFTYRIVYE